MLYRLAFQCCKNATKDLKIPRVNHSLTTHAAEWSPQIMEGKMFDRGQRQLIMLEQIKRAVHKNREVLVILRDHSAIFGRAPAIIEDKQIQFCSSDNKLPVVLPLEKIWTVGAAGV
jgi:hypothetical protein